MRAGKLDQRITIQRLDLVQDAIGEIVQTWVEVAVLWASVIDLSGREFIAAQAVTTEVTTKILIRYRAGILPSMRVVHGSDIYDIITVLKQGKDSLLMMAAKGASNG